MQSQENAIIHKVLSERYAVSFAQEIADQVGRLNDRDIQLLDIKELNDLAGDYRVRLRGLIRECRNLTGNASTARRFYAGHEHVFTRRQISDLWQIYRSVMADSAEMTRIYLAGLRQKKQASTPPRKEYRAAA